MLGVNLMKNRVWTFIDKRFLKGLFQYDSYVGEFEEKLNCVVLITVVLLIIFFFK